MVEQKIIPPEDRPFKLDLACGNDKEDDFFGIDLVETSKTDFVWDLETYPWPIDNEVVDEIRCNHYFEHIPGKNRFRFMDECYRIMKPDAKMVIVSPYWTSMRSIQDPTHEWPPVCEGSFLYFNAEWRKQTNMAHYPVKCNFEFTYGYGLDKELLVRNIEWQQFAVKHYLAAVHDLQVTLTRK